MRKNGKQTRTRKLQSIQGGFVLVRQIVLLSEASVGLFEQDYHFPPGGKQSDAKKNTRRTCKIV